MPPFPYPSENISGITGLISHADTLTAGFLGEGILIVIAIISFITTKTFSSEKAFLYSGFMTLLTAIILRFMNLVGDAVMYIVVVLFVGIVIWTWYAREQETV